MKEPEAGFEYGLMVCIDILENTKDSEKAAKKIDKILTLYREVVFLKRKRILGEQLGIYL